MRRHEMFCMKKSKLQLRKIRVLIKGKNTHTHRKPFPCCCQFLFPNLCSQAATVLVVTE